MEAPRSTSSASTGRSTNPKIEHVVVLMLENRSFDHMCGYLKTINSQIEGLTGKESNPYDPKNPSAGSVKVNPNAGYVTNTDPGHGIDGIIKQLYGGPSVLDAATNNGFVYDYNLKGDTADKGASIMECFSPNNVPCISTLATQFAVFDHWFAAVPGPTQPNRMFLHSGTSWGSTLNDTELLAMGYPQRTIYQNLSEVGVTWKDYFHDLPSLLFLAGVRNPYYWDCFSDFAEFSADCAQGTLPNYSFLEPRWFDLFEWPASDQGPPHNVAAGEYLIADVYEAVRNGPKWESTLLIITYDEHGGFYDHVAPPQKGVPPPDDKRPPADQTPFNFDRLGVRVPAIFVSPWINAHTVVHEPVAPATGHFTHTSILATAKKLFNTKSFLTARDAWSPTVDFVVNRTTMRTDCPTKLPRPGTAEQQQAWARSRRRVGPELIQQCIKLGLKGSQNPISDLQQEWITIARGLSEPGSLDAALARAQAAELRTEHDAALFVIRQVTDFLERNKRKASQKTEQSAVVDLVRNMFEFLQTHDNNITK